MFEVAYRKSSHLGEYSLQQQRSWLRKTADMAMMRRRRDWARRRRAFERTAAGSPTVVSDPVDELLEREAESARAVRDRRVREVLGSLRTEHRQVLEFSAAGLKGPAIAERLSISHQQARTWLMMARRDFHRRWRKLYDDDLASEQVT